MHIGINTLGINIGNSGGLQIYIENLLHALAKLDAHNQYTIFIHKGNNPYDYPKIQQSNFQYFECPVSPHSLKNMSLWINSVFYLVLKKTNVDLLHSPANLAPFFLPCPSIITIHDAISFHKNYLDVPLFYKFFQPIAIKLGVRRANEIITVSESSKKDIVNCLSLPQSNVRVVYHGVPDSSQKNTPGERSYKKPYILWIGRTTYFKNVIRLIEAYSILKKEKHMEYPLYLVGMKSGYHQAMMTSIKRLQLEDSVFFWGYQSRDQLQAFYKQASLFVFPSLIEGFGFPIVEAMSCGTPVVTSNRGAMKEVAGDAAYLVDPENVEDIAHGMWEVISNPDLQKQLILKGQERVKQFSWKKCAQQTLDVYESLYHRC